MRGTFTSKEEVEKACNEKDKCLGYNVKEGKEYHLLGKKIVRVCEGGVGIINPKESCKDDTLCVKKSK